MASFSQSQHIEVDQRHGRQLSSTMASTAPISGWNSFDEFGNLSAGATVATGPMNYGWLGGKQRAVSGAGLTLMGVRLYNPATALFTSIDPVQGGNANAYTYPSDSINSFDIDGKRRYYDDENPRHARFKSWWNSPRSILWGKAFFPNYPYKYARSAKYSKPQKAKKNHHWKRKWRSTRHWMGRRAKGAFFYGLRGAGAGGFLVGVGAGIATAGSGALAGAGWGAYYGSWFGIGYGLRRGSDKWW